MGPTSSFSISAAQYRLLSLSWSSRVLTMFLAAFRGLPFCEQGCQRNIVVVVRSILCRCSCLSLVTILLFRIGQIKRLMRYVAPYLSQLLFDLAGGFNFGTESLMCSFMFGSKVKVTHQLVDMEVLGVPYNNFHMSYNIAQLSSN